MNSRKALHWTFTRFTSYRVSGRPAVRLWSGCEQWQINWWY